MKCLKNGCNLTAEAGSNYCQRHQKVGTTHQQLRDETPEDDDSSKTVM